MSSTLAWPPNYTLRMSKRARYIRIVIDPEVGLQLVVPPHIKEADAIKFMHSKRAWLEKHADKIYPIVEKETTSAFPVEITLGCLGRTWQVHTMSLARRRAQCKEFANELVLMGNVSDFRLFIPLIKCWLKQKAEQHLVSIVKEMSKLTGLKYKQVSFRAQKSMWGSCSKEGEISLNIKLLFLPYVVAQYVVIHELCHTKHFNHSRRFWALVERYEPNYLSLKQQLLAADKFIPRWFYVD